MLKKGRHGEHSELREMTPRTLRRASCAGWNVARDPELEARVPGGGAGEVLGVGVEEHDAPGAGERRDVREVVHRVEAWGKKGVPRGYRVRGDRAGGRGSQPAASSVIVVSPVTL